MLSFYCECGERVINQFTEFDKLICECDWYTFPIELQRMLLTFMTSTQQPPIIHGFANAACTRESLKAVNALIPSLQTIVYNINLLTIIFRFSDNQSRVFILHDTSQNVQLKTTRLICFLRMKVSALPIFIEFEICYADFGANFETVTGSDSIKKIQ